MVEKSLRFIFEISIYPLLFWEPVANPLTVWNSSSLVSDAFFSTELTSVEMAKPVENKLSRVFSALVLVGTLLTYEMFGCLRVVKRFCIVLKSSKDGFWGSTFTSFFPSSGFCTLVVNRFCIVLKSSNLGTDLTGSSTLGAGSFMLIVAKRFCMVLNSYRQI